MQEARWPSWRASALVKLLAFLACSASRPNNKCQYVRGLLPGGGVAGFDHFGRFCAWLVVRDRPAGTMLPGIRESGKQVSLKKKNAPNRGFFLASLSAGMPRSFN